MFKSIKASASKIKVKASKLKSKAKNSSLRARAFIKRYRWRIFWVFLALVIVALTVALVLSAFKGVNITNQAVIINYSQERIINGTYTNRQILIGLGSRLFNVPKRNFLIYYGGQTQANLLDTKIKAEPINARVQQGTKIQVQARVLCKVQPNNLRDFLQEYGLDWNKYVIAKIKNSIIQTIATTKFYDLNSTRLISRLNQQFLGYQSLSYPGAYPFAIKVVSLELKYPDIWGEGFGTNNSTLGMELIVLKSEYTQLMNHYTDLSTNLNQNSTQLFAYSYQLGQLEGQLMRYEQSLEGSMGNWGTGLQVLSNVYSTDQKGLREFLWIYFQKMYNQTYNSYKI